MRKKEKIRTQYHYVRPDGSILGFSSDTFYDNGKKAPFVFRVNLKRHSFEGKIDAGGFNRGSKRWNYLVEMIEMIPPEIAQRYFEWRDDEDIIYKCSNPQLIHFESVRRFPKGFLFRLGDKIGHTVLKEYKARVINCSKLGKGIYRIQGGIIQEIPQWFCEEVRAAEEVRRG